MPRNMYAIPGGPGGVFPFRKKKRKKEKKIRCGCGGNLYFYDTGVFCYKKYVVRCDKCKYKNSVTL